LAVFGSSGPDSPQVNSLAVNTGERGEIRAAHRLSEEVVVLEIDRDHVGGQFTDLAAVHTPSRRQGASGLIYIGHCGDGSDDVRALGKQLIELDLEPLAVRNGHPRLLLLAQRQLA
jgi:hypothetical protein